MCVELDPECKLECALFVITSDVYVMWSCDLNEAIPIVILQ